MKIGQPWVGTPPSVCDLCARKILLSFVDGRTSDGRWGIMCPSCRVTEGRTQLGTGLGQKFDRPAGGGPFVKTAG